MAWECKGYRGISEVVAITPVRVVAWRNSSASASLPSIRRAWNTRDAVSDGSPRHPFLTPTRTFNSSNIDSITELALPTSPCCESQLTSLAAPSSRSTRQHLAAASPPSLSALPGGASIARRIACTTIHWCFSGAISDGFEAPPQPQPDAPLPTARAHASSRLAGCGQPRQAVAQGRSDLQARQSS